MQIDAVVLLPGRTNEIWTRQFRTDQNDDFHAMEEAERRVPSKDAWNELAIEINQRALHSRGGLHKPVNVFLCLRGSLLENFYNYEILERIVNDARNHAWGGNLYIAWNREGDFNRLCHKKEAMLVKCFRTLAESGVSDLIEMPRSGRSSEQTERLVLSERAMAAEHRRESLRKIVSGDRWGVVLPDDAQVLRNFVEMLETSDDLPADSDNRVAFYDRKPQRGLTALLEKSRSLNRRGNRLVAAVPGIDLHDVAGLWKQESLVLPPIPVNSAFEWIYSLIRLNKASHNRDAIEVPEFQNDVEANIEMVAPSGIRQFRSEPNKSDLCLLVTSAFHPDREADYCVAAAEEIGRLLRHLTLDIQIEVHPCVECETFPDLLEGRQYTAWLHISHGDGTQGLYEGQRAQYASAERWLKCFNVYQGSLQLVVLSVCESTALARLFAASGVRVAIGFEDRVLTEATARLTELVVPSALRNGDRQAAILQAFLKACSSLNSRGFTAPGGDESYGDARPKAFWVDLTSS